MKKKGEKGIESKEDTEKKTAAPLTLKNGIIVAGHPRSGTSLACQLLESAGVTFPSTFGPDEYNKSGYFEMEQAKELEKKLLDQAMTEENIIELNRVVENLNQGNGLTGLKIVHIPAIFFYRHIAKQLRVVFTFRHPADVKASILRRGISQFRLSWFENNNALIAAYENIPKSIVISYESLINGKAWVKKGFKKLGFKVDLNRVRQDERTQRNSRMIATSDELRVYKMLKRLERESCR